MLRLPPLPLQPGAPERKGCRRYVAIQKLSSLEFTKLYSPTADYCVKVDMLLSGMAAGQRRRFATLLNTLVGTGMCRAPSCKPQILPNVAMKYTLPDAICSEFMMDGPKVLPVLLVFPSALPCSCRASDQLVELALQR